MSRAGRRSSGRPVLNGVLALAFALGFWMSPSASADASIHVAVTTSFGPTFERIARAFETRGGGSVVASVGSTGRLYAQIVHGGPYELFLAADSERPRRLEAVGRVAPGGRFTYALGRLALWSAEPELVDGGSAVLSGDGFRRLAIANPELAPYGLAARQVLERLGHWDRLSARLVFGEDVGQVRHFVASRNAEVGFVALSQVEDRAEGSLWVVPAEFHEPIVQQAVILKNSSPAAARLARFLSSAEARRILHLAGYEDP